MNSIANPRRIEAPFVTRLVATGQPATVIATVILSVLIISFRPFQPAGAQLVGQGGDIVNQLGFGTLGALSLASMFTLTDRRVLTALLSPWWLLLFGFLFLSILNTPAPSATMRSAAFSIIGIISMAAVLTLPRDADAFSRVLMVSACAVLGLSYAGLVLFPNEAIHQGGEVEFQHAGLWRGVFTHKNIAGPVMACLSFVGIYLWRRGWRASGGAIFILAMIFVAHTGSKTTAGTVPLAGLLVILPGMFGLRALVPIAVAVAFIGTGVATLGIVFIEPVKALANQMMPDLTYTGRTALWEFMGEMIAQHPWRGYGFESFWLTDVVLTSDQPFDRSWDIRGIVHGHNSYLDLAIAMGLPALAVALVTFAVTPLRDYWRTPLYRENVFMADLFMMIVTFILLNGFLESFFFRRADPVWMFFVMAVLGLRLAGRFRVPTRVAR